MNTDLSRVTVPKELHCQCTLLCMLSGCFLHSYGCPFAICCSLSVIVIVALTCINHDQVRECIPGLAVPIQGSQHIAQLFHRRRKPSAARTSTIIHPIDAAGEHPVCCVQRFVANISADPAAGDPARPRSLAIRPIHLVPEVGPTTSNQRLGP